MRVKLNLQPPLQPLKAWFSAPEDTVISLKKAICTQIPGLDANSTLKLELDGFELLDGSAAKDVLREGDMIDVYAIGALTAKICFA